MPQILKLFPHHQRREIENAILTIIAAAPFAPHPIDAVAAALHRAAHDLRRTILAHDTTTADDDPQKLFAIAAAAEAARQKLIQPAAARIDRIIQTVAEGFTPPSTTPDIDDRKQLTAAERMRAARQKFNEIGQRIEEEIQRGNKKFAKQVARESRRRKTKQRQELRRQLKKGSNDV